MAIAPLAGVGAASSSMPVGRSVPTTSTTEAAGGPTFDQMLGKVFTDAIGAVQTGEAMAIQGIQGAVPAFKVVESIMSAQRSLQQAVSVRDKAVAAYQEIEHMSI